jgi:peptidoglycan hydrolase-like protein with peptidoglycan-binding domain
LVLGLAAIGSANADDGPSEVSEAEVGADDDFSFAPDGVSSDSGMSSCDDVVVVGSGTASVQVPGDDAFFDTSSTLNCAVDEGSDAEAVVVLQDALVRCNGQAIAVDGEFGPDTEQAVINVQQQHGIAADGAFGPATMGVMQWPTETSSGGTTCVSAP